MTILPKQMTEQLSFEVDVKFVMKEQENNLFYLVRIITRNSGPYGPFFLAPAEGFGAVGPQLKKILGQKNLGQQFFWDKNFWDKKFWDTIF